MHKRTSPALVAFIKELLFSLLRRPNDNPSPNYFAGFNRILLHDSTSIALGSHLSRHFPASGNQTGTKFAQLKIQTIYDIKSQTYQSFALTPYTRTEQTAASDIISLLQPRDLVLRDLGYFVINAMRNIEIAQAYYCSRLRFGVSLYDAKTQEPINLLKMLSKHNKLDINVLVGYHEKFPTRLVAIPVPLEKANQRRRKLNQIRDKRRNLSAEQLQLCNWEIFVTNIPANMCSAEQIWELYTLRWRIETIFKTWKSSCKIEILPVKASAVQVESIIYARLLLITLYNLSWADTSPTISLQKLTTFFTTFFWIVTGNSKGIDPQFIQMLITYFCSYERRKKRKNINQTLEKLSKPREDANCLILS